VTRTYGVAQRSTRVGLALAILCGSLLVANKLVGLSDIVSVLVAIAMVVLVTATASGRGLYSRPKTVGGEPIYGSSTGRRLVIVTIGIILLLRFGVRTTWETAVIAPAAFAIFMAILDRIVYRRKTDSQSHRERK
jgi:hypothetical protein